MHQQAIFDVTEKGYTLMRSFFYFHPLFRCVTSIITTFTMEKKIALFTVKGPPFFF